MIFERLIRCRIRSWFYNNILIDLVELCLHFKRFYVGNFNEIFRKMKTLNNIGEIIYDIIYLPNIILNVYLTHKTRGYYIPWFS